MIFSGQGGAQSVEAVGAQPKGLTPIKEDKFAEMDTPERFSKPSCMLSVYNVNISVCNCVAQTSSYLLAVHIVPESWKK
jgi:hypothetical protein